MQTPSQKKKINKTLALNGLASLADPRALLGQLAFILNTETKFRNLLLTVEPSKRQDAYDALKGRLKFTPKPLDVYIAEGKQEAEREKLPEWDEKTMQIRDHGQSVIDASAQRVILKAVREAEARGIMQFICSRCTFSVDLPAKGAAQGRMDAEESGWTFIKRSIVLTDKDNNEKAICPRCTIERAKQ